MSARPRLRAMEPPDAWCCADIDAVSQYAPWTESLFLECFRSNYHAWVLDEGGELVGFMVFSHVLDEASLLNIAIAPEHRRRGLARHLLAHGFAQCRKRGATVVHLEVRESNLPAIQLYESLGFTAIGQRKGYYPAPQGREAATLMLLRL